MSEKINYANCMQRRCDECKHYDYCFRYRPEKENENVFESKSKENKKFECKNNLVVNILNKKGYECDSSQISQIKANRKLNSEQRKVILENQNEKVSKNGSYYVWEADVIVKIVDKVTGKEV